MGDTVLELTQGSTGAWLVRTHGSHHLLDLDEMVSVRVPGTGASSFAFDRFPCRLREVQLWPKVGRLSILWADSPGPVRVLHCHITTPVVRIERLEPAGITREMFYSDGGGADSPPSPRRNTHG